MIVLKQSELTVPCVYQVLGAKDQVLYVGFGSSGMGRVFDISPEQRGRTKAFNQSTKIRVDFFSSKEKAAKTEIDLIHRFHPKGNRFCSRCGHYLKRRPKRLQGRGILFGKTRHTLLILLLGNSEKAYFLREICRLTGLSLGTTQRELSSLVSANIIRRTKMSNRVLFQAIVPSPFFNELRSMVTKGA